MAPDPKTADKNSITNLTLKRKHELVLLAILALIVFISLIIFHQGIRQIALRFGLLVFAGGLVFYLPLYALFFRQKGEAEVLKNFQGSLKNSLLLLGVITALVISVLLTGFSRWAVCTNMSSLGTVNNIDFLAVVGTAFTIWGAGTAGLVLAAQVYAQSKDASRLECVEKNICREIEKLSLREISDSEALETIKRWARSEEVVSLSIYGHYAVIPGLWLDYGEAMKTAVVELLDVNKTIRLELFGPNFDSVQTIAEYIKNLPDDSPIRQWSRTIPQKMRETSGIDLLKNTLKIYLSHVSSCRDDNQGVGLSRIRICLLQEPWKELPLTFALALNRAERPVGAIFFGDFLRRGTRADAIVNNVELQPSIKITEGDAVCSLLVHLRSFVHTLIETKKLQSEEI